MSKAMTNLKKTVVSDDDVQEISPRKMSAKRKRAAVEVVKVESDDELESGNDDEAAEEQESSSDDDNELRMRGGSFAPQQRGKKGNAKPKARKPARSKKVKI
jgi:hypothetical protein